LGSIIGFLSVAIGAFGAHAIKSTLDASPHGKVFEILSEKLGRRCYLNTVIGLSFVNIMSLRRSGIITM
jgi:uncharacterized membrane protein YgdD (TMEM256/DUF423 family)